MIAHVHNTDNDGLAFFAGLGILYLLILLVVWGACGAIAWYVAPEDRRWTFFWLAFLLLGPLSRLSFLPPRFCF